jgi:hypothetical protein
MQMVRLLVLFSQHLANGQPLIKLYMRSFRSVAMRAQSSRCSCTAGIVLVSCDVAFIVCLGFREIKTSLKLLCGVHPRSSLHQLELCTLMLTTLRAASRTLVR